MRVFYGAIFGLGSGFFQIGQKFSKMITNWGLNWSCSIMAEIAQREIGVWSAKQGRANELDNPPSSSWTLKLISNFSATTALPSSIECKKNQDVIALAITKEIPNSFDILNCSCIFFLLTNIMFCHHLATLYSKLLLTVVKLMKSYRSVSFNNQ